MDAEVETNTPFDYEAFKRVCDEIGEVALKLSKNPMNDELAAHIIHLMNIRGDILYYG